MVATTTHLASTPSSGPRRPRVGIVSPPAPELRDDRCPGSLLPPAIERALGRQLAAGRQAQDHLRALREAGRLVPKPAGVQLLAQVRAGQQARARLITACAPLVEALATRYGSYGVPREDLLQEGWVGVVRAAATFDPAKGPHFSKHAWWAVRKAILGALTGRSRLIRLPAGVVEAIRQIAAARHQWEQTEIEPPRVEDLAQMTGLSAARVRQILGLMDPPLSLDAPGPPAGEHTLGELVVDEPDATPETAGLAAVQRQELLAALAGLDPLARQVVTRRYGLADGAPRALDEVATVLRLPEADVRAIEAAALDTLRALLAAPVPSIPVD